MTESRAEEQIKGSKSKEQIKEQIKGVKSKSNKQIKGVRTL